MPLRLAAPILESPFGALLATGLLRNAGLVSFRKQTFNEPPTFCPIHFTPENVPESTPLTEAGWLPATTQPGPGFRPATVLDYAAAYRSGRTTPEEVARKCLAAIEASDSACPPLRAFIFVNREDVLQQARAASRRIKEGRALSLFDGVPVAVKDEVDMVPFPTTAGTSFLGTSAAGEDSTVVARMRAAGALLIGKTIMHEVGLGVTGLNLQQGTPRNPHDPGCHTGGSSSGSAAAVAAGFCPVAIGADGGGSIRIPASFCGLVGLKPTFGRVSEFGAIPLCWSVAHIGPIAATAADAALAYGVMAGPDVQDPMSLHQPAPRLTRLESSGLKGLTLGVFWPWFRQADAEVVRVCEHLLGELQKSGASIREVQLPDLESARVAHAIIITGEMAQALEHADRVHRREHGLDVRICFALARKYTANDYLKAQRVRTRMIAHFESALTGVDAILTPATGIAAPPIRGAALRGGELDLASTTEIMRFATPANLTGLPAIAFPAGYNERGLPIGMQAIGRAWHEEVLLRLAFAAEQLVERKAPQVHYDLLNK